MSSRNLKPFYTSIIIGAGINGAGILRENSLHNIDTLLVDRGDFCSQTSSKSSKMLHGGIRYLETFDFSLVSEALDEKNIWLKLSPNNCYEECFYLPNYHDSKYPLGMLYIGLKFYDLLSKFHNTPSSVMRQQKVLKEFPGLLQDGLRGAGKYYDAIVDDHKLGLECIWDAQVNPCAQAINYMELIHFEKTEGIFKLTLKDRITEDTHQTCCKYLSFSTGPFTDKLMQDLKVSHWQNRIVPNKGIHLWLKRDSLEISSPLVLQNKDNRIIFVIPQREAILIGTTEKLLKNTPFDLKATQGEIDYLLSILNLYFPKNNINHSHILSTFAGIRPLVRATGTADISKISRKHIVVRPYENCQVILGGKYTTFRVMSQDITREICNKEQIPFNETLSLSPLRKTSHSNTFQTAMTKEKIQKILRDEQVVTFEDLYQRRLSQVSEDNRSLIESMVVDNKLETIRNS